MRYSSAMYDGGHSPSWITPAVALVSSMLGAFGLWLANRTLGKAAFQTAINSGFRDLTDQLQEERAQVRREFEDYKIESARTEAQLRGEIINLTQAIQSLKLLIREKGWPLPEDRYPPAALTTMRDKT